MGKTSQRDKIIGYLYDYGSITPLDALQEFGCMRLAARIADIKDKHPELKINSKQEEGTNRYGEKTRFSRYFIESVRADN